MKVSYEIWGFSRHCSLLQRWIQIRENPKNRHSEKMQTTKNWVTKLNLSVKHLKRIFESFIFITWKYLLTFSGWFLSFCWKVKSWPPKAPDLKTGRAPPTTSVDVKLNIEVLKLNTSWQGCQMILMMICFCMDKKYKHPNKTKRFFLLHLFLG